jgi:hypothetical protein
MGAACSCLSDTTTVKEASPDFATSQPSPAPLKQADPPVSPHVKASKAEDGVDEWTPERAGLELLEDGRSFPKELYPAKPGEPNDVGLPYNPTFCGPPRHDLVYAMRRLPRRVGDSYRRRAQAHGRQPCNSSGVR